MKRDSPNRSQERVYVIHHTFERLYGFEFFFFSACLTEREIYTHLIYVTKSMNIQER